MCWVGECLRIDVARNRNGIVLLYQFTESEWGYLKKINNLKAQVNLYWIMKSPKIDEKVI